MTNEYYIKNTRFTDAYNYLTKIEGGLYNFGTINLSEKTETQYSIPIIG